MDAKTQNDSRVRLYFAGEATHREDAYTVHGAMLSGEREARKIKRWWTDHHAQLREVALGGEQQEDDRYGEQQEDDCFTMLPP